MRSETRTIMTAFIAGKAKRGARTTTDGQSVWLFGNRIAWREADGTICFTFAGWPTTTTCDRLNGLYDLLYGRRPFHQKKDVQYFNDNEIDTREVVRVLWCALARAA